MQQPIEERAASMRVSSARVIEAPVFLVGAERSGSTMLRLMLDHHPEIAFEHEFDLVVHLVSDEGALPSLDIYHQYLNTVFGMDYAVDRQLVYRELVNDFLLQKHRRTPQKRIVGATVHHHFDRLLHLWPDARFIHLVRDPRDVARSVVQKGWAGNLYQAAEFWREAERCWDVLVGKLPPERYIEVRYEELVASVRPQLTRICEFIGTRFSPSMLDYQADAQQYPKPDPALAYQWKSRLSAAETALVEARVGALMRARGYELCAPPKPVGPLRHRWLMLAARVTGVRHRVRKLGLALVLADLGGRRLGISRAERYASQRIRAIQEQELALEAAGLKAPSANIAPLSSARTLQGSS
jgi:hypothetical protein